MRGKVAEAVELFTAGEYHAVTILFQDKTALSLALEPGFTVRPTYEDRKSGTIQVLKEWAPIRTGSWRKPGDRCLVTGDRWEFCDRYGIGLNDL